MKDADGPPPTSLEMQQAFQRLGVTRKDGDVLSLEADKISCPVLSCTVLSVADSFCLLFTSVATWAADWRYNVYPFFRQNIQRLRAILGKNLDVC